jgi:Ca2+-binding EF-hand superfamily protein
LEKEQILSHNLKTLKQNLSKTRESPLRRESLKKSINEWKCPINLLSEMGCTKSKQGYRLTREDLEFLKNNTHYEETTIREWYKRYRIECPDNQMTQEKFIEMYRTYIPGGNAERLCEIVFKKYDSNKNGSLDFEEFILGMDMTNAATAEEKLKVAFRMYDLDGNGELDLDEMIKIVEDIYAMQRVYSKLGANNAKPTKTAEEQANDIFAQIDEDGDGNVTEEEFLAGCLENENLFKMLVPNIFQ